MCAWPMPSAGQGRSGVLASQMWTCASTIMRRAGCALAGSHAGDASARPAPAATVVVRTSRRDNIGGLLLRALSAMPWRRFLLFLVRAATTPAAFHPVRAYHPGRERRGLDQADISRALSR